MRVLRLVLTTTALAASACGAEWQTYHSASCDMLVDFEQPPSSGRSEKDQPNVWGLPSLHTTLTVHGVDGPPPRRWLMSCLSLPAAAVQGNSAENIAQEVATNEVAGLPEWQSTAVPVAPAPDIAVRRYSLAHKTQKDKVGRIEVRFVPGMLRVFTLIALDPPNDGEADEFMAGLRQVPKNQPGMSTAVDVRSAECLSSVVMPGWPHGTFDAGVGTHLLEQSDSIYQLRCIYLEEARAKAGADAIFDDVRQATVRDTGFTLKDERRTTLDGRAARELDLVSTDGKREMHARVTWDGTRIQAATLSAPAGPAGAAAARKFLASFHLLLPAAK